MKLETGYVYHIKNEYFDLVKDDKLMSNHEGNATRPNYYCLKLSEEDNLMWFVPMSSKIEKYQKLIISKKAKYGRCDTIVIGNYRNRETAFLLQNMFPITEKYISHIDTSNGVAMQVAKATRDDIIKKVNYIFNLRKRGINLIFPDIDKIKETLLNDK